MRNKVLRRTHSRFLPETEPIPGQVSAGPQRESVKPVLRWHYQLATHRNTVDRPSLSLIYYYGHRGQPQLRQVMWPFRPREPGTLKHKLRAGTKQLARGKLDRAVDLLSQVVQRVPDNLTARLNLGTAYYRLGQHTKAIEQFEQAIQVQPDNAKAWLNLGAARSSLGHLAQAEEALERVIEINPHHPDVHYNLAVVKLRRRQGLEALAELELELAANPRHRQARQLLAEIRSQYSGT